MKTTNIAILSLALTLVTGCTARTTVEQDQDAPREQGSIDAGPNGTSCAYLHGFATMSDYVAYDNYPESSFSFELASQDPDVTNNEYELLYDDNLFRVNLVTDDRSFIVDLGPIPLDEVPETVELDDYPVGTWGEHDGIQANAGHTYYVRSEDGGGRSVAAFQVVDLAPGHEVTIEWIRSTDVDVMQFPIGCD